MEKVYNLIGIGVGPFNLSLAALLEKVDGLTNLFFDQRDQFGWHPEVMFSDSYMQTSYLKDLVTPVDPTNPFSFLNYLVENGLFYAFMNTGRKIVSRREFEIYCQWASKKIGDRLRFKTSVHSVDYNKKQKKFIVHTSDGEYRSDHICVASGLVPRVPVCATDFIGPNLFHAKALDSKQFDISNRDILIVGGGQTGIEILRNGIHGKWGRPNSIQLVTRRQNLEPLDETAFTNEYFTPNYVRSFSKLNATQKEKILPQQKLASDGNTPTYLSDLYNDLYQLKYVEKDPLSINILPSRQLKRISQLEKRFTLTFENSFSDKNEELTADIVILCTGFHNKVPTYLNPIRELIDFDSESRFIFDESFSIHWKGPAENRIYALNFSRHHHGIAEPQISLMSWRSATVINNIKQENIYLKPKLAQNFATYH